MLQNDAIFCFFLGGGDIQIVDNKLTFKEESKSRVNSLANAKHVAGGGDVKVSIRNQFRQNDIFFESSAVTYSTFHKNALFDADR